MTKIELLFIRACKSRDATVQVIRVYKRYYYQELDFKHLAAVLTKIANDHSLTTVQRMIDALDPNNAWKYGCVDCTYYEQVCKFLVSEIRLTSVTKFPYYPLPAKFKRGVH